MTPSAKAVPTIQGMFKKIGLLTLAGGAVAQAATIPTVMPLGDSITDGYTTQGGYRIKLYQDLNGAVDFVGSASNGPASLPDHDHEGHNGFEIQNVITNIPSFFPSEPDAVGPDIILLTIGTNDILNGTDIAGMGGRLNTLLDGLTAARPNATVLLSNIIPIYWPNVTESMVTSYNSQIKNVIVPAHAAAGQRIMFVDQYSNFLDANGKPDYSNTVEGVHPTAVGYGLMADTWANAIRAVPEPTSVALLGLAFIAPLRRRQCSAS